MTHKILFHTEGNYNDSPHHEILKNENYVVPNQEVRNLKPVVWETWQGDNKELRFTGSLFLSRGNIKRKNISKNFRLVGKILHTRQIIFKNTEENMKAVYIFYIDTEYTINNLSHGAKLGRCDNFTGTGCHKKSSLFRLGFEHVKGCWIKGIPLIVKKI